MVYPFLFGNILHPLLPMIFSRFSTFFTECFLVAREDARREVAHIAKTNSNPYDQFTDEPSLMKEVDNYYLISKFTVCL